MEDKQTLFDMLKFHGHKCWASTVGLRAGLAALRVLGAKRSGAKSLHAILETGYHHAAGCFGDGVQYATGCTFGKGNIEKNPKGKLAVTVIDKAREKAVRISFKPTLREKIRNSAFMRKRSQGIPPDQIPEEEQMELVNLIWDAPEEDILTIGPVQDYKWEDPEELMRMVICEGCGEMVAESYMRVVNGRPACIDCAGYDV
ncbi:MAG: FmdE family protein [Thermodesulfovibrionales bacterium]